MGSKEKPRRVWLAIIIISLSIKPDTIIITLPFFFRPFQFIIHCFFLFSALDTYWYLISGCRVLKLVCPGSPLPCKTQQTNSFISFPLFYSRIILWVVPLILFILTGICNIIFKGFISKFSSLFVCFWILHYIIRWFNFFRIKFSCFAGWSEASIFFIYVYHSGILISWSNSRIGVFNWPNLNSICMFI